MGPCCRGWGKRTAVPEAVLGHFLGLSQHPSDTPVGRVDRLLCCVVRETGPWVMPWFRDITLGQAGSCLSAAMCARLQWALGHSSASPFRKCHSQDGSERGCSGWRKRGLCGGPLGLHGSLHCARDPFMTCESSPLKQLDRNLWGGGRQL